MYNNYDYLYSRPNVSMFSNVVGIEVPISDFENDFDDDKYTIYYISVEDVKEVINLELIVGDEENIADKDYKYEDVVKCQEIQEIKIDNKTYYSLEDYQNKRKVAIIWLL